ncbi:MAG: hypothetical protein B6I24_03265 [Bacteroidetes bacterium 4572_128]|nr:MAG: hypothetical protein B6I24_03265 [Bacteroidetes bacterium 4572_128]
MNKKRICEKCGKEHYCDAHHILPKGIFGEDGDIAYLCKNCHDEYHRVLGHKFLRKKNKQSMEFYIYKYYRWFVGFSIIIGLFIFAKYFI